MGRDQAGGGADLPAPYRNPWGLLREDLRAVRADLRLRARELWRRNGEGELWRPGWWPRDLAPVFWPVLAAAGLAVLVGLVLLLGRALPPAPPPAPSAHDVRPETGPAAPGPAPATAAADATTATATATATAAAAAAAQADGAAGSEAPAAPLPPAPRTSGLDAQVPSPPVSADPLALLLDRPEAAGLLEAARGEAASSTLTLSPTADFERLPATDRRRRAELWQRWARDLGYDHLELRDRRGGLRGRDALVGDGMILFSPQPPP